MKRMFFICLLSTTFVCQSIPQKIVVVGATCDIGQALIKLLVTKNHTVVAVDDEADLLEDLQKQEGEKLKTKLLPSLDPEAARLCLTQVIKDLNGLDICILCNSVAPEMDEYGMLKEGHIPWKASKDTISVNVMETTALANVALNHFIEHKKGYLVGISSLDALHGHPGCPCYTASKAFMSNYLEAMRQKCARLGLSHIAICDIRWSFVNDIKEDISIGWTETPEQAALLMLKAIEDKKPVAYIMSKVNFALWMLMNVPALLRNVVSGLSVLRYPQG